MIDESRLISAEPPPLPPRLEGLEGRNVPAAVVPPTGPVSRWAGAGSAADLVASNHGALNNGADISRGQETDGRRFDGNDDPVAPAAGLAGGETGRGRRD